MKLKLLVLVGVMLCNVSRSRAAQGGAPLLLLIGTAGDYGDLWAWDGPGKPLRQLTNWGYNTMPVISPDGTYVAYDSVPAFAIPPDCSGWPPFNIWVFTIASGEAVRIADQPPDGAYCGSPAVSFTRRPRPAWSVDGKSLAWGESPISAHEGPGPLKYRLVTYNLAQRSQHVIVPDLPGCQCITNGQEVFWGEYGIANSANDAQTNQGNLTIYDAAGKSLFNKVLDATFCLDGFPLNHWVKDGTRSVLDLCDRSQGTMQHVFDPSSGQESDIAAQLELYSPLAPDGLSLVAAPNSDNHWTWHIAAKGQSVYDIVGSNWDQYRQDGLTIAPDGQEAAFLLDKHLYLYNQSGQVAPVDLQLKQKEEIAWIGRGPVAWRTR